MKKLKKVIYSCVVLAVIVLSTLLSVLIIDKQNNHNGSNNGDISEKYDIPGVYWASEDEETGAAAASEEMKGGAVYLGPGTELIIDEGVYQFHEGYFGGCFYVAKDAVLVINGGTIQSNGAKYGGAIYIEDGGECYINGGTIENNAAEFGPAIWVEANGTLKFSNGVNDDTVMFQKNKYADFGKFKLYYYVDGVLTSFSEQKIAAFTTAEVPLSYNDCNGYFYDQEMTQPVEMGDVFQYSGTGDLVINSAVEPYKQINLYTKSSTNDKFEYTQLNNASYKVTPIGSGDFVMPKTYNGISVTQFDPVVTACTSFYINSNVLFIPECAFAGEIYDNDVLYKCAGTEISAINFTDNILEIQANAFNNCDNITNLKLPSQLTTIGDSAFAFCSNITTIDFPETLSSFGTYVFVANTSLKSVNIPTQVRVLSFGIFQSCTALENVTLPNGILALVTDAFCGCTSLKSITIPDSVTSLGHQLFSNCTSLETIDISTNSKLKSIGEYCFYNCNLIESLQIPNGVTKINKYTFAKCTNLTNLQLGSGITAFENTALEGCTAIEELKINISSISFKLATALNGIGADGNGVNIIIGSSVQSIVDSCFTKTTANITSVTFEEGIKSIGKSAFSGLANIKSIILPDSLEVLSGSAFASCSSLEEVYIGNNLNTIGNGAFYTCKNLKSITYNAKNVTSYPDLMANHVFYQAGASLIDESITLTIGADVEVLPSKFFVVGNTAKFDCVFENNSKLTSIESDLFINSKIQSIALPESIDYIRYRAFYKCSYLKTIQFNEGIIEIGESAFESCTSLTTAMLPESIETIQDRAFTSCTGLTELTIGTNVKSIGINAFTNCTGLTSVYYKAANAAYDNGPSAIYTVFDNAGTLSAGLTLTIASSVESLPNRFFTPAEASGLTGVVVEANSKLAAIPAYAFMNCAELKSINIPASVLELNSQCFNGCTSLDNVVIDGGVEKLYDRVFENCTSLESITLPDTLQTLNSWVFLNCTSLKSLTFPASVKKISGYVVKGCTSLTAINVLGAETAVEITAFRDYDALIDLYYNAATVSSALCSGKTNLARVTLGEDVTTIVGQAFRNCTSLESVVFEGTKVESMQAWAFANTPALTSIDLPEGLVKVYSYAFQGSGITSVTLPTTAARIGRDCFDSCTSVEFAGVTDSDYAYTWQIQSGEGYVWVNNVDLSNAEQNAIDMHGDYIAGYYIRSDYSAYVADKKILIVGTLDGDSEMYSICEEVNAKITSQTGAITNLTTSGYNTWDITGFPATLQQNSTIEITALICNDIGGNLVIYPHLYQYHDSAFYKFYYSTNNGSTYKPLNAKYLTISEEILIKVEITLLEDITDANIFNTIFFDCYSSSALPEDYIVNTDYSSQITTGTFTDTETTKYILVTGQDVVDIDSEYSSYDEIVLVIYELGSTLNSSIKFTGTEIKASIDFKRLVIIPASDDKVFNGGLYLHSFNAEEIIIQGLTLQGKYGYIRLYNHLKSINHMVVKDCNFYTTEMLSGYAAIQIEEQNDKKGNISNVYIQNNVIDGYYQGIMTRCVTNQYISNNTIKNTTHNAIGIQHYAQTTGSRFWGNVYIVNNTIQNIGKSGVGERAIRFGNGSHVNAVIAGNSFTNCIEIANGQILKTSALIGKGAIAIFDNTYEGSSCTESFVISTLTSGSVDQILAVNITHVNNNSQQEFYFEQEALSGGGFISETILPSTNILLTDPYQMRLNDDLAFTWIFMNNDPYSTSHLVVKPIVDNLPENFYVEWAYIFGNNDINNTVTDYFVVPKDEDYVRLFLYTHIIDATIPIEDYNFIVTFEVYDYNNAPDDFVKQFTIEVDRTVSPATVVTTDYIMQDSSTTKYVLNSTRESVIANNLFIVSSTEQAQSYLNSTDYTEDYILFFEKGTYGALTISDIGYTRRNVTFAAHSEAVFTGEIRVTTQNIENMCFTGMHFSGKSARIYIYIGSAGYANNIRIQNCTFETTEPDKVQDNSYGYGAIHIAGENTSSSISLENVYITNNTISGGHFHGIYVAGFKNATITNNTISDCHWNGIQITEINSSIKYSGNIIIALNTITNTVDRGIRLGLGENFTAYVYGNTFTNAVDADGELIKISAHPTGELIFVHNRNFGGTSLTVWLNNFHTKNQNSNYSYKP